MPKPWATCMDCMLASPGERPIPPTAPKSKPTVRAKKAAKSRGVPGEKRAPAAPSIGRLPRLEADPLPELMGDKDLAYEIPESDLEYFTSGSEAGWLPLSQMPKELRPGGFVYLQIDRYLVARARVSGIGFRDRRWDHAAPGAASDLGPGATLEVERWDGMTIDLGPDGEAPTTGYRYLREQSDGTVAVAPVTAH